MEKLTKNLYVLKDAVNIWYDYLNNGLLKRGWRQSSIDGCIFTNNGVIIVIYVIDAILIPPVKQIINYKITLLMKYYKLTNKGVLKDYLGTHLK